MKNDIRKEILKKRLNLDISLYKKYNQIIYEKVLEFLSNVEFNSIAMYYPFKKEVDLLKLVEVLKDKDILFPKVIGNNMIFVKINTFSDFKKGKFGIMEPIGESYGKEIDVYLIPGVAFDKRLYRLGYGGGYFDKYFSNQRSGLKVGIAFDFQIIDKLPIFDYDIKMDKIITEKRIIEGDY
jgi:5-formyltetrahydrofolate cyclo-ligase